MKKLFTFIVCILLILISQNGFAQLLQQQFTDVLTTGNLGGGTIISNSSVTVDPVYVNSAASNSQFTFLSTNNDLASIEINGDGVLRLVREGSGTVYVVRNTNFEGPPTNLEISFDFNVDSTASTSGQAVEFMIGQNFPNSNSNPTEKHSRFFINTKSPTGAPGTWGVTPENASSTSAYNTSETVSWFINHGSENILYTAPNGMVDTLVPDTYDLWVNTTKHYNDQIAIGPTVDLNNFEIRIGGGNGFYTIDNLNISEIPLVPGPIQSNGTGGGDWNDVSTWQGGVIPLSSDGVVVLGTDSVYTTVADTCNSLVVQSGGILALNASAALMVANSITMQANSFFYNSSSSPSLVGSSASYMLDDASTVVHIGSGTIGGGNNLTFGNLIIQRSSGVTAGGNLLINGNLTINNSSTSTTFRGTNGSLGSQTHHVAGNVYLNTGTWSCVDVGSPTTIGIWTVDGDVIVSSSNSRIGPFTSASADGLGIFNIGGDFVINGGRLQAGSSSTSGPGVGVFNLGGNFTFTSGAIATNSVGPFAINFVGTKPQTVSMGLNFSMSTTVNDTIMLGSEVIFDLGSNTWNVKDGTFLANGSFELKDSSTLVGTGSFYSGSTFKIGSSEGVSASDTLGNIQVTGLRNFAETTEYVYNSSQAQVTGDGLPSAVRNLVIDNGMGVLLTSDLTINDTLFVLNGDLDLNNSTLTLGSSAILSETPGNTVTGLSGKISTTRDLNAPSGENVGGLGAMLTSAANLGSTTIERIHVPAVGNGNTGIYRRYLVEPTNNDALDATLRFYYDESELNGIPESNLSLFKSLTGADSTWTLAGGTVNSSENYVELAALNNFSYWTLADLNNPVPVELTSFNANVVNNVVNLTWTTATELNNSGWDVERKSISVKNDQWIKVGFVKGSGSSTEAKNYLFKDENVTSGKYSYRLKQIDFDGSVSYSFNTEISITGPDKFELYQNYPNPFNPETVIKFEIPTSSFVNLSVYNLIGEKVATLKNENVEQGSHSIKFSGSNLPSGVYIYRLTAGNTNITKKMTLLK